MEDFDSMSTTPGRDEAIEMLRNGHIKQWNEIRDRNPDWIPDLRGAILTGAKLERPDLKDDKVYVNEHTHWGANLSYAMLQDSNFDHANLSYVDFEGASMRNSSFKGVHLYRTNFSRTRLNLANFKDARFEYTNFENADLSDISFSRKSRYRGIRVSTSYGNVEFRRFAQDQDFLTEFKERNLWCSFIYYLWLITCDCGRSMLRWIAWSILFTLGFAKVYYDMGQEAFEILWLKWKYLTLVYYSVVTFTTLGFGDVVPKTPGASIWVMAEVMLGYIMLGGLISIFANKLARRG